MKRKKKAGTIGYVIFLSLFLFVMIAPMLYMISASFMPQSDLNMIPPRLLPSKATLENYARALAQQPIIKYVYNSFIITIIAIVICVTAGSMASYALTRTNIRFKTTFLVFVLAISLLPTITLINPIFKMYSNMGLLNTHIGLAVIISVLDLPMTIWFLTAVLKNVPISFEESAKLDGANMFQIFIYILLPLLKASIFSISILVFIGAWNRFLLSQVLNQFEDCRTVVVGLTLYQTTHTIPFGVVAAAAMITILPLLLMVLVFQKNILGGIMEGGVKE
ncbi:MAG: carbohydrate ABC transporter permease [Lachnospiraceae bacterium]|nr:carbohydrate ABC transporter permease [Lachnospiraceae bacterium]